ncbi:hypothetical protein CASFOL_026782 [Castilleja foliolosa]|uniref:Uncharacterized protein n=1 Tax=Castilleja foliolosa TaxID=1961234 RepID=A0ABD3CLC9_9LAMI
MANKRKNTLLYSDLFKLEKEEENMVISSSSSSPRGSSSSGFSTPFYSDFESSDGDFMAELTRQMAECMLQEEDDEKVKDRVFEDPKAISSSVKNNEQSYVDKLKNGLNSGPPFHQVNELKNQPPVSNCWGKRVKEAELAQQKQLQKTQQQRYNRQSQYRGRNGSGMQAVFLGGSGSRNGPPGTGVFLPRVASDPTELKNKSGGCSIVLMPTRVLQTLEVHFRQRQQPHSKVPSLIGSGGSIINSVPKDESTKLNGHSQLEKNQRLGINREEEVQLPQEWTY